MAFPTIATQANGTQTSNSTSWTLTYPSGVAAGDLLLIFVGRDGTGSTYSATGFTLFTRGTDGDAAANSIAVLGKSADGTETGNFTLTTDSEQGIWQVLRITGWFGGTLLTNTATDQDTDSFSSNLNSDAAASPSTTPVVTGNDGAGAMDPANWGAEDTLWIAAASWDGTPTATGKDANFTYVTNSPATSGGAGGAGLALSYRQLNASSLVPGNYTISASEQWVTVFMAIRPAAAATPRVPYYRPMTQLLAH